MSTAKLSAVGFGFLLILGLTGVSEADRHEIWVANRGTDKVQILDGNTLKVKAQVSVGKKPQSVTFSPDFKRAYVANAGSGDVTVIDTSSRTAVATLKAGKSAAHAVSSPDGRLLYVTNPADSTVSVVDSAGLTVVKTIPVGKAPVMTLFAPEGKKAYVTSGGDGTVSVVDVEKGEVAKTVQGVGRGATGLFLVAPNLYVTAEGDNKVSVIDTKKDEVVKVIPVGKGPYGISASGFGGMVLVANRLSRDVSVIDTDALEVTGTIRGLNSPSLMASSPKGFNLFITEGGREPGIAVVEPFRSEVITRVKLTGDPHGIAVKR